MSRTPLASANNDLTMPPLPPMAFNPLIPGHAPQPFTLTNGSRPIMIPQNPQTMMAHGPHPFLMAHGTQPMMPYGAQPLMANGSQMQADSAMRAAVYKFTESIRRPNYGQNDPYRSSTPIGDMSPIAPLRPHDNLQVTHDHDQLQSGHRQSNHERGWFRVNPAGSLPPNTTPDGFKVPG